MSTNNYGIPMSECTVQLWYNKQRIKKNGNASLYLQIIVGQDHPVVALNKLEWPVSKFDWKKKCLKPRFPDDPDILVFNAAIERERGKYWDVIRKFIANDQDFTITDIFREVNLYKSGHLFCEFMQNAILARQKTRVKKDMIKESTARLHRSTLKILRTYLCDADIDIKRVDDQFLERFADHLRKTISENSVWVKIQNIKSYLSYAYRNKVGINHEYKRCMIRQDEPDPVWLEEDELERLQDLYWKPGLAAEHRRNLKAFLFAAFTGLRISDLQRWSKDWIKGNQISFIPVKRMKSARSSRPLNIPIVPAAWDFIDHLTAETFELPEDQVYNRGLKVLAKMANIDKNITSHVARHTFATSLAISGVPVLAISKLLGHKSTTTSQIYIHISEAYLTKQMMLMQKRFGRRGGLNEKAPGEEPSVG